MAVNSAIGKPPLPRSAGSFSLFYHSHLRNATFVLFLIEKLFVLPIKSFSFLKKALKSTRIYGNIIICEMTYHALCMSEFWRIDLMKLFITILQLICGLAIILAVLFQSGKSAGLSGTIGGVADSFLAKNQAKSIDAKIARASKWVGAAFLILTIVLLILG
jgi:preprotein translocase subunit SecG